MNRDVREGGAKAPPEAGGITPLLDQVRRFAYPRGTGGDGERRAGDEVAAAFAAAGLEVRRQPFTAAGGAVHRLRLIAHVVGAAVVAAVGASAAERPGAAAVLALAGLAWLVAAGRWNRRIEGAFDLGPAIRSGNVEGIRKARGDGAPCVVVMAHRDTKSSLWPTFVPAVVVLLAAASLAAAAVWAGVAALAGGPGPALAVPGAVLAALLVAVAINPSGDASPGAMDNASGLAVLLAAARELPRDHALRDAELRFLCTGAEEVGLAGALRWIVAHAAELDARRTVFVNVDSVGVGTRLLAADVRGHAPGGAAMSAVVRRAAKTAGVPLRVLALLPAAGVDTMPIAARGFATVTLLGEVAGGAALRIHTARDTVGHLNEAGLQGALDVVRSLAREVASAS